MCIIYKVYTQKGFKKTGYFKNKILIVKFKICCQNGLLFHVPEDLLNGFLAKRWINKSIDHMLDVR